MKNIVIYTMRDNHYEDFLYTSLGIAFEKLGYRVILFDALMKNREANLKKCLENNEIDFTIGHNELGVYDTTSFEWLYKYYKKIVHVCILDDAPYNIWTQNVQKVKCEHLLIAYRDRSHFSYLQHLNISNNLFFLPFWALIPVENAYLSDEGRDIDIFFSRRYYRHCGRVWDISEFPKAMRMKLNIAADILERNALPVDSVMQNIMPKSSDEQNEYIRNCFYSSYMMMFEYIKTYRRTKLMNALLDAGFSVTVWSDSWKNFQQSSKLNFIQADNTEEILNLYKRSRILVQDMAEFNDGSHSRIGDVTICGAAIISEYSKYLGEIFTSDELLMFNWSKLDMLPSHVQYLLDHPNERKHRVRKMFRKVEKYCLSEQAARVVLANVEKYRNTHLV